jgi:hypothetical protein
LDCDILLGYVVFQSELQAAACDVRIVPGEVHTGSVILIPASRDEKASGAGTEHDLLHDFAQERIPTSFPVHLLVIALASRDIHIVPSCHGIHVSHDYTSIPIFTGIHTFSPQCVPRQRRASALKGY